MSHLARLLLGGGGVRPGQVEFRQGTHEWVVPNGVHSISVLVVEGGASGTRGSPGERCSAYFSGGGVGGAGGIGGRSRYINSITVTPGQVIPISVTPNRMTVSAGSVLTSRSGGIAAGTAESGERGHNGTAGFFGGVNGANGADGRGIAPGNPLDRSGDGWGGGGGGGGGGRAYHDSSLPSGTCVPGTGNTPLPNAGIPGGVRIIWPGHSRQFPSTRTQDE